MDDEQQKYIDKIRAVTDTIAQAVVNTGEGWGCRCLGVWVPQPIDELWRNWTALFWVERPGARIPALHEIGSSLSYAPIEDVIEDWRKELVRAALTSRTTADIWVPFDSNGAW